MSTFQENMETKSAGFDRAKYYREYYQRNKEKLCEQRTENYRRRKGAKALKEYAYTHLDEDLVVIRDELMNIDESDPEQYELCIAMMKIAKLLLEIKTVAIGGGMEEIERIRNLPVEN
jgi:hypothetical protein